MSTPSLRDRYAEALVAHAHEEREELLAQVHALGRECVRANIPPEELGEFHEDALVLLAAQMSGAISADMAR